MSATLRTDRCVCPFRKPGEKGHVGKDLQVMSKIDLKKFPGLPATSRVCSQCRKLLMKQRNTEMSVDNSNDSLTNTDTDESSLSVDVDNSTFSDKDENNLRSPREIELEEIYDDLKRTFSSLNPSDPLRLRILTITHSTWSARKIANEFGTTRHLALKAKNLRLKNGILGETTKKAGKSLPESTVDKIIDFYNSDTNSRIMPGKKDCITMKVNNEVRKEQKRFVLFDLKELYDSFTTCNPNCIVGFSTFAKLRPANCILAGASGTHSVCVCTIHENVKLLIDAIGLQKVTANSDKPLSNYTDCINEFVCKESRPDCYIDECDHCPGTIELSTRLCTLLNDLSISDVQFSAWTGTDRSTLITQTLGVTEFVNLLCEKLTILKSHSFITKQQMAFISERKENLCEDEVIVMFDFSENYAYVCQNASQAFHFNNNQCTVFPVIYYYKQNSQLMHKSQVFLSDSLKHDTAAVYTIQTLLIPEIKKDVQHLTKIIYMTDGAKQHFKNKFQIANLLHHKQDFNIDAEWHYSTTAHGKSGYDGIGATFKREAYKASLVAKPQDAILTPQALTNWATRHFKNIRIFYFKQTDHERMRRKLNKRFDMAQPVPEILKNHGFVVVRENQVLIKRYSNQKDGKLWGSEATRKK